MRPALCKAALAAVCLSALALAGCGKHVASNAPVSYAPADTPYLFANFKGIPADVAAAWGQVSDATLSGNMQQLGQVADGLSARDPEVSKVVAAIQAELANAHSTKDLAQTIGFSQSALFAVYGIGDVPVGRIELASPDAFKAFWARVEKRSGVTIPTATVDKQSYWVIGGANAKVHILVAVEGQQLVVTLAPTKVSPDLLKRLLGLTKPASNASDRLAGIDSRQGYGDYGSGYLDPPKLFANIFDGKDSATQEFAKDLGGSLSNPACASEFASLANQAPLASFGFKTFTAKTVRSSLDIQLSSSLLGALTALKQPVAGMDVKSDNAMLDAVLALPLKKWQAFIQDRAKLAAEKAYQCPALQSLNRFAQTAANPPIQMPPQAASLLGFRLILDQWDDGPKLAARALVASSDPAGLAQQIQQTMPQFALKTIPTDGTPVAFPLPPRLQPMISGNNQGWIAADAHSLVIGVGAGEEAKLADALHASAGNGDLLFRLHMDGKMYGVLGSLFGRFAAMAPASSQARLQQQIAAFTQMGKMIQTVDADARLDGKGLHIETTREHR